MSFSFGYDTLQVRSFLEKSTHSGNFHYLGFSSLDEVKSAKLGEPFRVDLVDSDMVKTYPLTGFSRESGKRFLPVLVDNQAVCLVTLNSQRKAVTLGRSALAVELSKISRMYGVSIESIALYKSPQVKSYLFSVQQNTRSSSPNLTILRPGWDYSRSNALIPESATLEILKGVVK